ncbi:MAG: hypothetical protein A2275_17725 [Bacteroidetes bacterium RIFOXYA12_FULL_35_11]|nr:MAG: hypothetical protein A2X01_14650 [Bacteroidetes bacterium GWF2_35_48]OFY80579.1 MAG: hypothetical protein A2275_17725 [Bacteroidetes bacterium RIFOXYA12_FULL_35_11]OFY97948.1 MAG: hypothetical protein A2309_07960 [Bacteroidetes bacterium RIFOXYB2_FULL_35_7]OFZ05901.1 MAG: hypothetical protein A2491_18565 [Bacteroidetes bacterium RIFOXYC12_FULL_35_7]HBX50044.1 DUF3109 domain-containing protein [Bacteroidales bacterium]
MLQIENTIISLDVLEKKFCCDLQKCKGCCCVNGDSGAPLTIEETGILSDIYPEIKKYLREEGIHAIESNGLFYTDSEFDQVTMLINGKECAFTIIEDGIYKCAIEKAFYNGDIDFQKPLSCHLYPIRIKKHSRFEAVNYNEWVLCKPALQNGEELNIPLYIAVKDALIRKYGQEWFDQLDYAAKNLKIEK